MTDVSQNQGNDKPEIIILGAGPAGLAAAHALTGQARVTVIERAPIAGGNSASFPVEGVICDYGSHRFHPAAEPEVLADVKALLGDDLLLRPAPWAHPSGWQVDSLPVETDRCADAPAQALCRVADRGHGAETLP